MTDPAPVDTHSISLDEYVRSVVREEIVKLSVLAASKEQPKFPPDSGNPISKDGKRKSTHWLPMYIKQPNGHGADEMLCECTCHSTQWISTEPPNAYKHRRMCTFCRKDLLVPFWFQ